MLHTINVPNPTSNAKIVIMFDIPAMTSSAEETEVTDSVLNWIEIQHLHPVSLQRTQLDQTLHVEIEEDSLNYELDLDQEDPPSPNSLQLSKIGESVVIGTIWSV
jgi:hypothetical protein